MTSDNFSRALRGHARQGKSGLELSCGANIFGMRLLSRPDVLRPTRSAPTSKVESPAALNPSGARVRPCGAGRREKPRVVTRRGGMSQ